MTNPFEDLAASGTGTKHVRKKIARQPMMPTEREKEQLDQKKQFGLYLKWKREIRRGMAEGDYGPEIVGMLRFLRKIPDGPTVVTWINDQQWLVKGNLKLRYFAHSCISHMMMRWNIRHGIAPLNDSLPWQPDSPSVTVRKLLLEV